MEHVIFIAFLFALGACIGSFLNVVVYRLPLDLSLVSPPSRCPQCETPLAWYDNLPIVGWLKLGGKCRYCKKPISPRYPIVEAVTGLLFVFYYVMLFMAGVGPCLMQPLPGGMMRITHLNSLMEEWPIYFLYMLLISGLLAASLIDAELFIIPASIPWWIAGIGILVHALVDHRSLPGSLIIAPWAMALSAGAAIGLIISIVLLQLKILPISFPEGNLLEVDREHLQTQARRAKEQGREAPEIPDDFTPAQVRSEIRKEMLFLMPPLLLGGLFVFLQIRIPAVARLWEHAGEFDWLSGFFGAVLGAMVGGFVVWIFRILGSLGFGREAMGLGDVHLMLGVGAVLGAGAATVAFFLAPFFGIAFAIYLLLTGSRRQLPYGPYLSLAAAFVMLFYCPIAGYLRPGMEGLLFILQGK